NPPSVPSPTVYFDQSTMSSHGTMALSPGYYPNGITLGSQRSLTLSAGVYYIENGLQLGAQTSISGTGVTIFLKSGSVNMTGGASVTLSAPSSGTWQGILFYQDRGN